MDTLKAPFPWFGGKSRVAHIVWQRFSNVPNYVEPFFGSGAVLLNRPTPPGVETVNDRDCYLSNFWRALQADPDAVTHYADFPVSEPDLHARHRWLLAQADFRERMMSDPDYYDAKIAGWWVWGLCQWIGSGWCEERYYQGAGWKTRPHLGNAGRGGYRAPSAQLPHLGNAGVGIHRPSEQLPHLGDAGRCIPRPASPSQKMPHVGNPGRGVHRRSQENGIYAYLQALSDRLRRVRVCCGDWTRILGPSPTTKIGLTAVFLDPPYSAEADRDESLYGVDDLDVAHDVRKWAIEHGDDPLLRIALCGYRSEFSEMPTGWTCVNWKAPGGYGSQGNGRGRKNSAEEVIWFSPYCLHPQLSLFDYAEQVSNGHEYEYMV